MLVNCDEIKVQVVKSNHEKSSYMGSNGLSLYHHPIRVHLWRGWGWGWRIRGNIFRQVYSYSKKWLAVNMEYNFVIAYSLASISSHLSACISSLKLAYISISLDLAHISKKYITRNLFFFPFIRFIMWHITLFFDVNNE